MKYIVLSKYFKPQERFALRHLCKDTPNLFEVILFRNRAHLVVRGYEGWEELKQTLNAKALDCEHTNITGERRAKDFLEKINNITIKDEDLIDV